MYNYIQVYAFNVTFKELLMMKIHTTVPGAFIRDRWIAYYYRHHLHV